MALTSRFVEGSSKRTTGVLDPIVSANLTRCFIPDEKKRSSFCRVLGSSSRSKMISGVIVGNSGFNCA